MQQLVKQLVGKKSITEDLLVVLVLKYTKRFYFGTACK